MVAGCGMKCIKFTIFFFNFLFLLVGTALIILGGYAITFVQPYVEALPVLNIGPVIIIVIGSMIFIPSFFGCCGAIRESRCMLITYAVLMGILMLLEVIIAIVGFVYGLKMRDTMDKFFNEALNNAADTGYDPVFGIVHRVFKCCGIHSSNDWKDKPAGNTNAPVSCCIPRSSEDCNVTNILTQPPEVQALQIFTTGCLETAETQVKGLLFIISGIAIGIALVELIGILFAACLAKAVKNRD